MVLMYMVLCWPNFFNLSALNPPVLSCRFSLYCNLYFTALPSAGILRVLLKDCKSSSSVAEYLILYVLLMVEARLRSDSS